MFGKSLVRKILSIRYIETILIEASGIDGRTLIVSIIIKYSGRESGRSKFSLFCIKIMRFIEKCSYFLYICILIPYFSECWIDDSVPNLDISIFSSIRREEVHLRAWIIDEALLIEINIWIQAREAGSITVNDRYRDISYEDSTDERCDTILTIAFVVEFFIFCCYRLRWCISIDDEERYSRISEI